MNVNLDDLFDTGSQGSQVRTPGYAQPPPPSVPPPPPVMQQRDPFAVDTVPPVLPPPSFESVASAPFPLPCHGSGQQRQFVSHGYPYGAYHATAATPAVVATPTPGGAAYSQPPLHSAVASNHAMPYAPPPFPVPSDSPAPDSFTLASVAPPATNALPVQLPVVGGASAVNPVVLQGISTLSQEEEDRKQLEKIIKLRKELEKEREKERKTREELETWGCSKCTYRNSLAVSVCEMCECARPGYDLPITTGAVSGKQIVPMALKPTHAPSSVPAAGPTAWLCSTCFAPNEARHANCKVCNSSQRSGTVTAAVPASAPMGSGTAVSPHVVANAWLCGICGKTNIVASARCEQCQGYQSSGTLIHDPSYGQGHAGKAVAAAATWICSACTLENSANEALCTACQSGQRPRHLAPPKKERSGDESLASQKWWACPSCTFQNTWALEVCEMCSTKQPAHLRLSQPGVAAAKQENLSDGVQWQSDDAVKECNRCQQPFTFNRRRHHCRACGYVFCATCSPFRLALRGDVQERVCVSCYEARK